MFVLNVKKIYNITLKRTRPHFTYKNRKYVRPQLTWGSSLPNQLFQDLEITFNFAHPCSFPFPLIFTVFCSITLILFTLFTLSYFFSSPLSILFSYSLPYFTVSSNRFIHQLLPVIYSMLLNAGYPVFVFSFFSFNYLLS